MLKAHMKYMLDTNICIYIIKKHPQVVYSHFKGLKIGDVCVSAITVSELQYGIFKSSKPTENQLALASFLTPLHILDFPVAAATSFGKVRVELEKKGTPIGNYDLLIAAHALCMGLTLVTNNVKEFARIPGLNIENWAH
jgi:tRNA(fMet)-specific endonuclease VapC